MDRRHFELAQGYLNIDADALIFTRSGNWQEAANTKERSSRDMPGRFARNGLGVVLVVTGGSFFALGKMRHLDAFPLFGLALLGLGIYSFYGKVRHDFAPSFRIPFGKVMELDHEDGQLRIRFLNAAHQEDTYAPLVPNAAGEFAVAMFADSRDH